MNIVAANSLSHLLLFQMIGSLDFQLVTLKMVISEPILKTVNFCIFAIIYKKLMKEGFILDKIKTLSMDCQDNGLVIMEI